MSEEISIYKINNIDIFEKTTCQIIEKCYTTGSHTLVLAQDDSFMEMLNKSLWTYSQKTFIPHGSIRDEQPEMQPVLISTKLENKNNSKILVLVGNIECDIDGFEKVIFILSNHVSNDIRYEKIKGEHEVHKLFVMDANGVWIK